MIPLANKGGGEKATTGEPQDVAVTKPQEGQDRKIEARRIASKSPMVEGVLPRH